MQASIDQILSSYDDRAPLERASTIPAAWYVDPRIAELERLNVFSKTWQLVARTDQVEKPGDFVATRIAGEPVVSGRAICGACAESWVCTRSRLSRRLSRRSLGLL